jgi:hypothetical protein
MAFGSFFVFSNGAMATAMAMVMANMAMAMANIALQCTFPLQVV